MFIFLSTRECVCCSCCLIAQKWNEFQEAGGDSGTQAAFVCDRLEEVKAHSDPF